MNIGPKTIKETLKKYRIRPSKRLGQNFLINGAIFKGIIKTADPNSGDEILEIGPGIGGLTQELARKSKRVVAVEKDLKMTEVLKEALRRFKNIQIVREDVLKFEPKNYSLKPGAYKIVANLPYYIASPVIRKFLEAKNPPKLMVLMIQKEVAQRIAARPPDMNLLAISVQFYARPQIIFYASKNSFWPRPKVDGAVIKISQICKKFPQTDADLFFKIVKAGFSQPRKQIINNLAKGLRQEKERVKKWLLQNNVQPNQRAETLKIENWIKLTKTFNSC